MKIVIVSDLHGNMEAVRSLPSGYDELWVLGDLVNYGPNPSEVIEFVRRNASLVVRGNHDHSLGFDQDPQCSARFRRMAEETGRYTRSVISEEQREYLRSLPLTAERVSGGVRFMLCHAAPGNPLYEYRPKDSELWEIDLGAGAADILLAGHTHIPFQRRLGRRLVANPGSAGQPKHGAPRACYASWEDGELRLGSSEYPFEETIAKVLGLPISNEVRLELSAVLRAGSAP
jgi:protein phosphatase